LGADSEIELARYDKFARRLHAVRDDLAGRPARLHRENLRFVQHIIAVELEAPANVALEPFRAAALVLATSSRNSGVNTVIGAARSLNFVLSRLSARLFCARYPMSPVDETVKGLRRTGSSGLAEGGT
jgi:hypothetical protein